MERRGLNNRGGTTERSGRSTLADVARAAGVSTATASLVLNRPNSPVAAATRERVMDAARDLRYAKSALVAALQQGRTLTLGVQFNPRRGILPSDPVMARVMSGISQAAHERGYHLLLYTGFSRDASEAPVETFLDQRVDGVILIAPQIDSVLVADLAEVGLPAVVLFNRHVPETLGFVNPDNETGIRLAVRHLWETGHRKIVYIDFNSRSSNFNDRRNACEAAFAECGLDGSEGTFLRADEFASDSLLLDALLNAPERPTAILCYNDNTALRMKRELEMRGISIPEQMSLAGFDDCILATAVTPALTTVRQPLEEIGSSAVSSLIDIIEGTPAAERRLTLPVELVVRETTAAPRSSLP